MDFWHLIGRGVDKRDIVLDDKDRVRFIHDLYSFNDLNPVTNFILHSRHEALNERDLLVNIHAFCLMNNHYHLLVSECKEGGISLFMKKLNMGYTKYFNERYDRSGALWQGKYRKVLIERNAHFLYIPFYIHLNPLDYTHPEWRKGEVTQTNEALASLRGYRWSSHLDYLGISNFSSLISTVFLSPILGTQQSYESKIINLIQDQALAQGSLLLEYKN